MHGATGAEKAWRRALHDGVVKNGAWARQKPVWRNVLLVLMGMLPLIAGIWDAYSHKKAEKELIKQYGFMGRVFTKARSLVDEATHATIEKGEMEHADPSDLDARSLQRKIDRMTVAKPKQVETTRIAGKSE